MNVQKNWESERKLWLKPNTSKVCGVEASLANAGTVMLSN